MIEFYRPSIGELGFRQRLLSDLETMSFNPGGTIDFPEEKWTEWYRRWLEPEGGERFYRYIRDSRSGELVGEAAWYFDDVRNIYICSIIIAAARRGRGYGGEALELLCREARAMGISEIYDDIAPGNRSVGLFLRHGFTVVSSDDVAVLVKRQL